MEPYDYILIYAMLCFLTVSFLYFHKYVSVVPLF